MDEKYKYKVMFQLPGYNKWYNSGEKFTTKNSAENYIFGEKIFGVGSEYKTVSLKKK